MSYVFRPHTNGELRTDWFRSAPYLQNEIDAIRDPEGGAGQFLPTAIPSPFARFDLVNTAFQNLSRTPKLVTYKQLDVTKGSQEEEKLVSDALDVLELIYNADQFAPELKIVPWDPAAMIAELEAGSLAHQQVAQALQLFMRQDAKVYHFDKLKRLYLVIYKFQVIGCTSPMTLAAASGNDLHDVQIRIAGDYSLFDGKYEPLYKRDPEFQYYLYAMLQSDRFITELKGINDYLKKNKELLRELNPELYNRINTLTPENYAKEFKEVETGIAGSVAEVCGINLRKRNLDRLKEEVQASDFVITPTREVNGTLPLVLQNGLNQDFKYVQNTWNQQQKVPYYDPLPLNERRLPGLSIDYPYLTVSDLLEPCLIGLPYYVDSTNYFDGNLKEEKPGGMNGFILPLKPLFFTYFNATDLFRLHPDGKPWFLLHRHANNDSITAELRLPVQKSGGYITLSRTYTVHKTSAGVAAKPDELTNSGIAIERKIAVTHFPVFRYANPDLVTPHYRVQLLDLDKTGLYTDDVPQLLFLDSGVPVEIPNPVLRGLKTELSFSSTYFCFEHNFDAIIVRTRLGGGVLIPKWKPLRNNGTVFSFAIDFGTSNTHVEYIAGSGGEPRALEATAKGDDIQIASLVKPGDENAAVASNLRAIIEKEFLPFEIGGISNYGFPQRTVLAESTTKPLDDAARPLANAHIAFLYERDDIINHGIMSSNLKWKANELNGELRVKLFYEQLFLMIRNKILLAGGNVQQTRIIWSYPFSMNGGLIDKMKDMIEVFYRKFFNTQFNKDLDEKLSPARLLALPESFGPYYYFKSKNLIPGSTAERYAVTVDIGGGTSDVFVFRGQKPILCTSFRFAANALYGGWFSNQQVNENGMLRKYVPLFKKQLAGEQGDSKLLGLLESMAENQSAADVASFLFSLENNKQTKNSGLFDFNKMLQRDDDLRIIFLFFYTAIVYHIAQLIKKDYQLKNEEPVIPGGLLFSGTGSKILKIITTNTAKLAQLTGLVFATVFEKKYGDNPMYTIYRPEDLKAATAKGGLYSLAGNQNRIDFNTIQCVYHPDSPAPQPVVYAAADKSFFKAYNTELKQFADHFIAWDDTISYTKELLVSAEAFELFKTGIYTNIQTTEDDFQTMLSMDKIQPDSKQPIAETLFFYPVIRTLNSMWEPLAELKQVSV